jgi:putative membrane protein
LMILLVARLVKGFHVSSFWTAFFASIFVSILSVAMGALVSHGNPETEIRMPQGSTWL